MKKLVVVVENMMALATSNGPIKSNKDRIEFTGKNLQAINKSADSVEVSGMNISSGLEPLVIKDGADVLAVFRVWDYWQKLE